MQPGPGAIHPHGWRAAAVMAAELLDEPKHSNYGQSEPRCPLQRTLKLRKRQFYSR